MEKRFNLFLTEEVHKEIKVKATMEGKSMNDYILESIKQKLDKPQKAIK